MTTQHCEFWKDEKDIKIAIMHKLPDWSEREDLVGWVRGDEAANPEVTNELARLSHENSELREKLAVRKESFGGLDFDGLVELLRQDRLDFAGLDAVTAQFAAILDICGLTHPYNDTQFFAHVLKHSGHIFDYFMDYLAREQIFVLAHTMYKNLIKIPEYYLMSRLVSFDLVTKKLDEERMGIPHYCFTISDMGRIFRNRLLSFGDRETRQNLLAHVG